MRVALIHPPTADPTAPYLAVPMLTGFLRAHGVDVLPIDANVEAFDDLLSEAWLGRQRDHIEARLAALDTQEALTHADQLAYVALHDARAAAHAVPAVIAEAKRILRDPERFYDPQLYQDATTTIDAALRVISAAHHPLQMDFTAYRTPFGLLSLDEVAQAAEPAENPFHAWVEEVLIPRLAAASVGLVGLSTAFPGQLQPAYAFALQIKRALPQVHVTLGGPGATQMLIRLRGAALARALGPFDSAVVFEGEHVLLGLVRALESGGDPATVGNVVVRRPDGTAGYTSHPSMEDLRKLPAPDFDGLPLARYFAPTLTLPYDPTRGCYWGKCTFCHYGLAEVGTASYRERDVATMVGHLGALSARYGTRHFYLSQDSVAPKTLVRLAEALERAALGIRWGTDLKAEKYLTAERAETLRRGGAIACAIGVESASDRVLALIDKGPPVAVLAGAMAHLTRAGVAAEAMCFTDFPTETFDEALETLQWLADHRDDVAVAIVGRFGLTHGSLVARAPSAFGISETWEVEGDELGLGIFFRPTVPWKDEVEAAALDEALGEVSQLWYLRPYPWAGAVSTAHTLLFYERLGRDVFKTWADREPALVGRIIGTPMILATPDGIGSGAALAFDLEAARDAEGREAALWAHLVHVERAVSRARWAARAAELPRLARAARPMPGEAMWVAPGGTLRRPNTAPGAAGGH